MSRESFSKKIITDLLDRIEALDNNRLDLFLQSSEDFEMALALAYMTLSKEKIIKKDMNNTNRLDRIERRIEEDEITSLFRGPHPPTIESTRENDYTWILDNFRDSIMHESFDVKEEDKEIKIQNKWFDRELTATIPFEWFKNYLEQKVLSKRIGNRFTTNRFYYNHYHDNDHKIKAFYAVYDHIYYKVDVKGENLPVQELEKNIEQWMREFSEEEVTKDDIFFFRMGNDPNEGGYEERYYISFLKAKNKLKERIEKTYPNSNANIYLNFRKTKLFEKSKKTFLRTYDKYDDLYDSLTRLVRRKSISLLNVIAKIYDGMQKKRENGEDPILDIIRLVEGEDATIGKDSIANYNRFLEAKKSLLLALIHILGLTSIILNYGNKSDKLEEKISSHIVAFSKKALSNHQTKRKQLYKACIDSFIQRTNMLNNYKNCPQPAKAKVKTLLMDAEERLLKNVQELEQLEDNYSMRQYSQSSQLMIDNIRIKQQKKIEQLKQKVVTSPDVVRQRYFGDLLLKELEKLEKFESLYYYGECNEKETTEILRNCFAHIGRISFDHYYPIEESYVRFHDYDNDNCLVGMAECKYRDLLYVLSNGYQREVTKQKEVQS